MKFTLSSSTLVCLLALPAVQGWVSSSSRSRTSTTALSQASSLTERVKKMGGGIPLQPAGDFHLFDPSTDGKLASCRERISQSFAYEYLPAVLPGQHQDDDDDSSFDVPPVPVPEHLDVAQNFLEDVDGSVLVKNSAPTEATVLGRVPLITPEAPGDIQHVLLELPTAFNFLEGQSISITPPGIDPKNQKPHKPRLYSIASTRYGELLDGTTLSLCVRRAEFTDPDTGVVDPSKKGVCSNYLCDLPAGAKVQIAGPFGKTMLLPEDVSDKDLIMVATGTGIAPFRGFLRRLFAENTVARHQYNGKAWLVLGVPVTGGLLYADEWEQMKQEYPDQFDYTYAISREMVNPLTGTKLYVQDILKQNAATILDKLQNQGAHIYFCGRKGMMPGVLQTMEEVAGGPEAWKGLQSTLKKNGQWHVEVY